VALLTFLVSFLVRKANNIIQAVFGWSVTALFGRLRRRAQVLVTGALVVSLMWPVFVVGMFAPRVSAWVIAFVPMHKLSDTTVLRLVWTALAVAAPLLVGLIIRIAAPRRDASLPGALLRGYPLALGFALAFVTVAVTVPVIKIASLVRRWSDEHVFVQPHDGRYDAVVACLVEACHRAGLEPRIGAARRAMVLATTIMRTLARGAVSPFVADSLQRVTAPDLELYMYPGDLLMRGKPFEVARVRSMLARTELDANAYLVDSDPAKAMQDELAAVAKERRLDVPRLQAVYRRLLHADVTFDEWAVLDGIARRLERRLMTNLPLDKVGETVADHVRAAS
jgi:hypothetical protein